MSLGGIDLPRLCHMTIIKKRQVKRKNNMLLDYYLLEIVYHHLFHPVCFECCTYIISTFISMSKISNTVKASLTFWSRNYNPKPSPKSLFFSRV